MTAAPAAVIFDLGGVVFESPLDEIARYEAEFDLAPGVVNRTVHHSGQAGAWARHERGEVDRVTFLGLFEGELAQAGAVVDAEALMHRIDRSITPRPVMVAAVRTLRTAGRSVAAVTNNWTPFPAGGIRLEFDVFVESVAEGVRKPEPEIYRRCLQRLGVEAAQAVMLDDLGPNLKPARQMGMATIKVTETGQALRDLEAITGVRFAGVSSA
ncbi:MAG: HAD family hydrolase [Acidimicrobiia bacterium]